MKKSKILSLVLSVVLMLSSMSVMAITFDDVESDPTVSWAQDSIHKMSDAGYIKGYEDGTFRPYRAITKMECLIFMARMLGFENEEYADFREAAVAQYEEVAAKYNETYAEEISYLLYCGTLKESDLVDYVSATNANTSLLRYQAAILMSKLTSADAEAKAFTVETATYADNDTIPTNARPYVEYVTKKGLMNGMDANEAGEPQFSPITSLTRAQMATLLARVMDKIDLTIISGEVEKIEDEIIIVDKAEIPLADSTKYYGSVSEGDTVLVIVSCDKALVVSEAEGNEPETVYGVILQKNQGTDGYQIKLGDYEDNDIYKVYTLSSDCDIRVGSTTASFADLKAKDFVEAVVNGSKIVSIKTTATSVTVEGKLSSVEAYEDGTVYLNVLDTKGVNLTKYTASSSVRVYRDGLDVEIADLADGDLVTLKLNYGKVIRVTATSTSSSVNAYLTEINISANPTVTLSIDGEENVYKLRPDVKIYVAGEPSDIYGLRINKNITVKFESSEIKHISVSTSGVSTTGEFVGEVTAKNTGYKLISIKDENGNTRSVYYKSNTTFLNSNGQSATIKSIEPGMNISVTGVDNNGIFEATIIIIK